MWASRLPLALPTCEYRSSAWPRLVQSSHNSSVWSRDACGSYVRAVLTCWLCDEGSCHSLCVKLCEQTHVDYTTKVASVLHDQTCMSEHGGKFPFVGAEFLMCDKNVITEEKHNVENLSDPCSSTLNRPKSRVTSSRTATEVYLFNLWFVDSLALYGNVLRVEFFLFILCRNSFYFLSRFLVKYFKYFKVCGVRI